MFRNTRRGFTGLGALIAVGVVIAGWLGTAGLLWKTYQDAGVEASQCQVVCAQAGEETKAG